ncbi:hypothetical protein LARV_00013 [Longilinea arvoryzae]|uniref:Uncharacterized protein n=1 Tax=Longilinea arvoryzae TaxID=360412 RepID=A0A0S7BB62_9CHLR|nr:hypothetical protein [Longilinea arvoryzae]GAP12281.1 hypothetical protein LARV_00013 [Longilinea arvoryzae]
MTSKALDPRIMMAIGVFLMLVGIALPLLILIKVLESTYFLNFFSYICQILGLVIAMLGLVTYTRLHKK